MKRAITAIGGLALLAASGCLHSAVNSVGPQQHPVNEPNYEKVVISPMLAADARVYGIHSSRVNDVLMAQVDVENITPFAQKLEYQFTWLDPNGMKVGATSSHWFPFTLGTGQTQNLQAVAPTQAATDFRFEVRKRG